MALCKKLILDQFPWHSSSVFNPLFHCLVLTTLNLLNSTIHYIINIHLNAVLQCKPAPPTWSPFIIFSKYFIVSNMPVIFRGKYAFSIFITHMSQADFCQLHHACRSKSNKVAITKYFQIILFFNNFFQYKNSLLILSSSSSSSSSLSSSSSSSHRRIYFHIIFTHEYPTQFSSHVQISQCVSNFRQQDFNKQ